MQEHIAGVPHNRYQVPAVQTDMSDNSISLVHWKSSYCRLHLGSMVLSARKPCICLFKTTSNHMAAKHMTLTRYPSAQRVAVINMSLITSLALPASIDLAPQCGRSIFKRHIGDHYIEADRELPAGRAHASSIGCPRQLKGAQSLLRFQVNNTDPFVVVCSYQQPCAAVSLCELQPICDAVV